MEHVTIELVNATIGYKTKSKATIVASNLNGSLLKGKLVSLVGRNGCGKSTLLRTIAGFQPLLEGCVIQEGKEIQEYSIQERARILSIVTTNTMHVQDMTVFDLVAMGRSPYTGFWGKLGQEDKEIIAESLRIVGMEQYIDRMVETLSDGERQKVMIAKAIAQETSVIILDEPTSFLDYPSKIKTMQLLRTLAHDKNKTVFLSTHDLEQALQFSDDIWMLDDDRNLVIRNPKQMISEGILEKTFGYINWLQNLE